MSGTVTTRIPQLLSRNEQQILNQWTENQARDRSSQGRVPEAELREDSRALLNALRLALQRGQVEDISDQAWSDTRDLLTEISRRRAKSGFSASETARFVFSLKEVLFAELEREYGSDAKTLAQESWRTGTLIDNLGLFTTEVYQKAREEVIGRQQQELMELSTPVVKLWQGILALPLIGTLDSERTQIVMENLLEQVVAAEATIAIIDITGVPTVDTLVAQHLLKTVAAARLMGADCIISGIRPQIAATIVHLGLDLGNVITKSNLADAFALALRRLGLKVTQASSRRSPVADEHGTNSDT